MKNNKAVTTVDNQQPNNNGSPQKSKKKQTGNWGEQVAAEYLMAQGCVIRERQWRGAHFEIDIVAQKGKRIIFCEVKTRSNEDSDPVSAVDRKRRQHMINAADIYLKTMDMPFDYQFDIISVIGNAHNYHLEHIADAFFPTPKTRH